MFIHAAAVLNPENVDRLGWAHGLTGEVEGCISGDIHALGLPSEVRKSCRGRVKRKKVADPPALRGMRTTDFLTFRQFPPPQSGLRENQADSRGLSRTLSQRACHGDSELVSPAGRPWLSYEISRCSHFRAGWQVFRTAPQSRHRKKQAA